MFAGVLQAGIVNEQTPPAEGIQLTGRCPFFTYNDFYIFSRYIAKFQNRHVNNIVIGNTLVIPQMEKVLSRNTPQLA